MRVLNSLQFRLLAVLLVLTALIGFLFFLNTQIAEEQDQRVDQIDRAGLQRSNAYLLASLARRLSTTEDEAVRQSIIGLMEEVIENFDEIQNGLRNGNEELELQPIERAELIVILDEIDVRWQSYRALLEDYIAADNTRRIELTPQIDDQSVTLFTFADRLVLGIDEVVEADAQATNRLVLGLSIVTAIVVLIAVVVVFQIARSARALAATAGELAQGNLSTRAAGSPLVEINEVGQVFNDMANQIETRIAEVEAAREAAERSDQVKSAFLASMSHELRTPMNAVINFTKFVAKGDLGPVNEQQAETLEEAIDSAKHLLNLINDVLDMSKIESGSLRLFVDDNVDINALLETTVSTGRGLLNGKTIDIQTDIAPNLPTIRGDRQRILQILLNIMSNAVKFTDEGYVKTKAYQENGNIIVTVEDTGPGIAPEDQPAVFEPFKQTASGLRKGGGTGLGMPIAKNLTEAHGGRIWIDSEPGKGATFHVSIPVRAEHLQVTTVTARTQEVA